MKALYLIAIVSLFASSGSSYADYKNPTSHKDCYITKIPLWHEIPKTRKRASACFWDVHKNVPMSQWRSTKASCSVMGVYVECVHLYQKACDQRDRVDLIQKTCRANYAKYRLRQEEEKERQKAFEQEQKRLAEEHADKEREARRAQQESETEILRSHANDQARFWQESIKNAANKELLGEQGKVVLDLQSRIKKAKLLRAKNKQTLILSMLGVKKPSFNAHSLSGVLTKYGTRLILGANATAQNDLQNALTNFDKSIEGERSNSNQIYNSTNPRPTASQVDEVYAMHQSVQSLITNVISNENDLPLGTQSIVNIASGVLVYKLMEKKINREISSLSNAMIEYTKSVSDKALEGDQPELVDKSSQVDLKKERLAIINNINKEKNRLAAIQAKERQRIAAQARKRERERIAEQARERQRIAAQAREQERIASSVKSFQKPAIQCLEYYGNYEYDKNTPSNHFLTVYRNLCGKKIRCLANNEYRDHFIGRELGEVRFRSSTKVALQDIQCSYLN